MTTATVEDVALGQVAAALAAALPVADAAAGAPEPVADPAQLVPGPGSTAVQVGLGGELEGAAMLLLSSRLGEVLTAEGALADAAALLLARAFAVVPGVELLSLSGVSPDVVFDGFGATPGLQMVQVSAEGRHAATLAVAAASRPAPAAPEPATVTFEQLTPTAVPQAVGRDSRLDLLRDVQMAVSVELGRTRMTVHELLSMTPGVVVELDRAAGSPVDLLVNGTLIARGEVVVVDEEFGVRITEIVGPGTENGGLV